MKNLHTFESYEFEIYNPYKLAIKEYGEPFPFKYLSPGDKVTYMGSSSEVVEVDDYILTLKSSNKEGSIFKVNQGLFDSKGFISKQNKPENYNPENYNP